VTLYIVTGPPAAGKSTWVRENAKYGDITIDYDAIAGTLTPPGGKPHDWPAHIKAVTKAARRAAIDTAVQLSGQHAVYVIDSSPSARLLDEYRQRGAQIITIDPGRATVMDRAKRERPWRIQQAAKQWYDKNADRQQTYNAIQQTPVDDTRDW